MRRNRSPRVADQASNDEQSSDYEKKLVRLMRFVDGDVTASEREVMQKEIENDPEAQQIVAQLRALAAEMSAKFAFVANSPVPQRLIDTIFQAPAGGAAAMPASRGLQPAARPRSTFNLSEWIGAWLSPPRLAMVAACAVAAVGIGFLYQGGPAKHAAGTLRIADGRAEADGLLKRALETAKSNVVIPARAEESTVISAETRMTFKARSGNYCRQYLLEAPGGHFGGIACREAGGKWVVTDHRPVAPAKSVLAGDPSAVFVGPISKLISGNPLGDSDEEKALARKWAD